MKNFHFKKNNQQKMKELEKDLSCFVKNWKKIKKESSLYNEKAFLDEIAQNILDLHRHAKEASSINLWKSGSDLILYILQTPWGAPFISEISLLEAATIYSDEKSKESRLRTFLKDISKYAKRCDISPLTSLDLLKEELVALEVAA